MSDERDDEYNPLDEYEGYASPEDIPSGVKLASTMPLPLVAIIGRANVGKSTLFNRIVGRRKAIVESTPGVTRDRHYERCEHYDRHFLLVDTGGLGLDPQGIEAQVSVQTQLAIEEADVIVFLIDGAAGLTAAERDIYATLRKREIPVLVAANKMDIKGARNNAAEIHELGIDHFYPISAEHGREVGELIEAIEEALPDVEKSAQDIDYEGATPIAVVGRPNVGKSTLINRLLGENRLVVSEIAGTTRDPIDTKIDLNGKPYVFIDTAGIRRKARISARVEKFSVLYSFRAIERAEIVLVVFDATEGLTEQDRRLCGLVEEAGRAMILVANKWDLQPRGKDERAKFEDRIDFLLPGLRYAPLVEISAEKGEGMKPLIKEIERVKVKFNARFTTSRLNELLQLATEQNPPPVPRGRPLKLNYVTQVKTAPPVFMLYTNNIKDFPKNYRRYLVNQFRDRLQLDCVPVHIKLKLKHGKRASMPKQKDAGPRGSAATRGRLKRR
ncbi:MAG: ribosome biogenesis GTPase Der [Chrysiogenetes bacterium]|nr:ribosome biogenesis GTPase Der [Chrysiogenetes bacterium]